MTSSAFSTETVSLKRAARSRLLWIGTIVWAIAFVAVAIRVAVGGSRNDLFPTYLQAGVAWIHGQPLYHTHQGFIYTPLVAAFFALLAWIPPHLGAALWRFANLMAFLAAALGWFRRHAPDPSADRQGIFLLLLFPISLGNLNNGQVNPLMISLLISAVLLARAQRWTLSTLCITVAAYFKVYPLAIGLLLAVVYPRELSWRLLLGFVGVGLLSFYALLAARRHPLWMRGTVMASYGVLVVGLALNSFLHLKKDIYLKSVQPLGALLFVIYACAWIFSQRWWEKAEVSPES